MKDEATAAGLNQLYDAALDTRPKTDPLRAKQLLAWGVHADCDAL